MKANELRIGNLLQGEPISNVNQGIYGDGVVAITGYGIHMMEIMNLDYNPIPLTEEWLVKLGFNTEDGKLYISPNGYAFTLQKNGVVKFMGLIFRKNMKYVHQLQNLYFALTRNELQLIS